jgi:pyruvate dehydrogenase E1 component beta subunit
MALMNMIQAINSALGEEMARDDRVLVLGEDVGKLGGVFRATSDLQERFGAERVIDTPLSETGIVGTAIGMALYGLRPVAEIQFADFLYPAMDQIVNEAAKYRYRSGGEFSCPLVIRVPSGGGVKGGLYHSQSPEAMFIHTAGLKVVSPSGPYDAKALLLSAIRDPDPVVFFEPKRIYRTTKEEVPEGDCAVELGRARVVREGSQVTVVAWGAMLGEALAAARRATLWPVDLDTVVKSVQKTGRLVVVHEAARACGFGAELVAEICEKVFEHLEAPPRRVAGWDTPFPYALEEEYLPLVHRIEPALLETARF